MHHSRLNFQLKNFPSTQTIQIKTQVPRLVIQSDKDDDDELLFAQFLITMINIMIFNQSLYLS